MSRREVSSRVVIIKEVDRRVSRREVSSRAVRIMEIDGRVSRREVSSRVVSSLEEGDDQHSGENHRGGRIDVASNKLVAMRT